VTSEQVGDERVRALVAELSRQPRPPARHARQLWWLLVWQEIAIVHTLETRGLLALSQRDRAALHRRLMRGTLAEIQSLTRLATR